MSTNPGASGAPTTATTTSIAASTAKAPSVLASRSTVKTTAPRPPRRTATHRMERLGVDFAIPSAGKAEAEVASANPPTTTQPFSRMPSQRRRRLWTLAARAAARREHPSQDKEAALLSSGSQASKHLGESSTQSGSFLKPGTVRTQDSGISSMDYVTSRDANSPNSEEAGFRQRTSIPTGLEQQPYGTVVRQPQPSIPHQHTGPRWPTSRGTKIVVSGEAPMVRCANFCNVYVPEWARRNWSSAPRPLISRQRSSMEVSYDIAPDWAASMETLNMQHTLYPQNRRLFYGRFGRASCPKATSFFEHPYPTAHVEEEDIEQRVGEEEALQTAEQLCRRRFEAPCWCETPLPPQAQAPPPPPHHQLAGPPPALRQHSYNLLAPRTMFSPYYHCSGCPYRCLETSSLLPPSQHQCDLGQRHIRRRRLKRMASEPTPPTWMSEEAPAPPKRRPPPPEPITAVTSPPPLPRKNIESSSGQALSRPPMERARVVSSMPRTDVYLMTSDQGDWQRTRRRGFVGLMRGRSVDETYYSPRCERQPSFLSDMRHPASIYEEREMRGDWGMPAAYHYHYQPQQYHQRRLDEEMTTGGFSHPYQPPPTMGAPYGIRPSSCRPVRPSTSTWYPTSPRCSTTLLRPRSESGSRPPGPLGCSTTLRGSHGRPRLGGGGGRSATSSVESSDATAATAPVAPPWQLTSPLCASSTGVRGGGARFQGSRRRISRSAGGSSTELNVAARRKRGRLTAMPQNVEVLHSETASARGGDSQKELDIKWKRKSFKRSNGYDASDVLDRTPSTSQERTELLRLRHQPSSTTAVVHEPREKEEEEEEEEVAQEAKPLYQEQREEDVERVTRKKGAGERRGNQEEVSVSVASAPATSPSMAAPNTNSRDLKAGPHKSLSVMDYIDGTSGVTDASDNDSADGDDIDKVVASVMSPRSAPLAGCSSSSTLPRTQKLLSPVVSNGTELAILGFSNYTDYWEHPAFGRSRVVAIVLAVFAISCLFYCLMASTWLYSGTPGNMTCRGLWRKCFINGGICNVTIPFFSERDGWQGGATCILLVAIIVGLLGTGLAIFGHMGSELVKRLYYFHSSGEIFFLAGFTTFLTFGIYRSYANLNVLSQRPPNPPSPTTTAILNSTHTVAEASSLLSPPTNATAGANTAPFYYFGPADAVGWTAGIVFMISAVALLLDEFLHELARLGQLRWPRLGRCLHWCSLRVITLNRRVRIGQRRCIGALRHKPTTSSLAVNPPSVTPVAISSFPYRPTTGESFKRRRLWPPRS